jgi:purine-cytosine permease-like protein
VQAVDLSPVAPSAQSQRPGDLFLIFLGANIVATTLQVGASLTGTLAVGPALAIIAVGGIAGAALVAGLAPIGSRLGVPSIVAARAVLGFNGARTLAIWLFVTNFAWIALNDVIAASIAVRLTGLGSTATWAVGLGLLAAAVVASGPRGVALADRLAVPLLVISGIVFTVACLRLPWPSLPETAPPGATMILRGLDVVAGYQVSWLLMFADYPRYVGSGRRAGLAVFAGLALAALWFMPLGVIASVIAESADPGAMVHAVGIGWWGAVLLTLATLTTNFVNIYMSALAFKALRPAARDRPTVWLIGGVGAALGLLSATWLEQFANLVLLLAGAFVPIGGILLAHYVVLREPVRVADLYGADGPYWRHRGWSLAGAAAWLAGAVVFFLAEPIGATLPSLLTAIVVYSVAMRWPRPAR